MKKILFIFLLPLSFVHAQGYMRSFNSMFFLSEDTGWINFNKDTLSHIKTTTYKTTDGGLNWVELPPEYSGGGIEFVNDSVGFLGNQYLFRTHLYKTTDRGETWELMIEGLDFNALDFITENVGYGVLPGHPYCLVKTTNSGVTWDTMSNLPSTRALYKVLTESKLLVYDFTIDSARYWLSTNSGITWEPKYSRNYFVYFYDSLYGYSYNIKDSTLYRTTDGGETWEKKSSLIYAVLPIDSVNALGATNNKRGPFLITHDGFTTYETKYSNAYVLEYAYKSCEALYACGEVYYLAKSTDCGDTWIPLTVDGLPSYTDVSDGPIINSYSLTQNYPNPFNPTTKIKYTIPKQGLVTIKVYDVLGKELMQLVNEEKNTGEYEIEFDGSSLSSGIYFYQIQTGEFLDTKKMVLMK